jgi:branched-subunit amino acid aminotransferase/4-amino-4-deoxychorismate lyase
MRPVAARANAAPFGLLETLRCQDGAAPLLALHQRRLESSWPAFFSGKAPSLARVAADAIARAGPEGALVRVGFRGSPRGRAKAEVDSRALPAVPRRVAVAIAIAPRRLPAAARRHKTLDRAWVDELSIDGAFETIVWDEEGGMLEGTRSNLFVLQERVLVTPPVESGLVPGVVRAWLVDFAARLGLSVRERRIAPEDLRTSGLILTGSGVGIVAVAECDGRAIASRAAVALAARLSGSAWAPR